MPTTRALSPLTTGEAVVRDMLYDGDPREEPGAIVCRVAPSFLRFGSFELLAARDDQRTLQQLADFTLATQFAELDRAPGTPSSYAALFHEVCGRTALLVAHWMRVGFVHGAMNTDNMAILGLTLDYGPFGFLDRYDPAFTPNTTDVSDRYCYAAQPPIAKWNLLKLAESLFPLVRSVEPLRAGLALYDATFAAEQRRMLAEKLGLLPDESSAETGPLSLTRLVHDLFQLLPLTEADFTLFFRALADAPADAGSTPDDLLLRLAPACYVSPESVARDTRERTLDWLHRYTERVRADARPSDERRARMLAANPRYILRNFQAQRAIEAAEAGDFAPLNELLDVLRAPYSHQPGRERFGEKRPDWARDRVGYSRLSCSS